MWLWRKRLGARLPPLGSRVCVSVTPCGFRGGRNGVWVGFLGVSPVFPYHNFHSTISPHSSHPFQSISSALVMVRHPCYSLTYNIGSSSHIIPRPDLVLETSWGYFIYFLLFLIITDTDDDFWQQLQPAEEVFKFPFRSRATAHRIYKRYSGIAYECCISKGCTILELRSYCAPITS